MTWNALTHDGKFAEVEDDVANVVREMSRLYPELKIQYIPQPEMGEAPYRVVELCKDNVERPVLSLWQLDNRLLDLLREADMHKQNTLTVVDAQNKEKAKIKLAKDLDWRGAAKEVLAAFAKSSKGRWSFPDTRPGHEGEVITVDDDPNRRTAIKD